METTKVLIVGRDNLSNEVAKSRLIEYDQELYVSTSDFTSFLAYIQSERQSLVVLDVEGGCKNTELRIRQIKESKQNYDTPIIICISDFISDDILSALGAGALDIIRKPYSSIELYSRVRAALSLSSSLQKINNQNKIINEGKEHVSEVLHNLLPKQIIKEYELTGEAKPKRYTNATVMFADMVDFTRKSAKLAPKVIVEELSEIFAAFDRIIQKNNCVRIKTMGDGYMAVAGIPTEGDNHAINMLNASMEMRDYLSQRNKINAVKWEVRIGINSGEVIGSLMGRTNLQFDVFGETVNMASRMEKNCEANHINVSSSTYLRVRHKYEFIERLPNQVKGLGVKRMFYLKKKVEKSVRRERLVQSMKVAGINGLFVS